MKPKVRVEYVRGRTPFSDADQHFALYKLGKVTRERESLDVCIM
jgi:hypothetical protein